MSLLQQHKDFEEVEENENIINEQEAKQKVKQYKQKVKEHKKQVKLAKKKAKKKVKITSLSDKQIEDESGKRNTDSPELRKIQQNNILTAKNN